MKSNLICVTAPPGSFWYMRPGTARRKAIIDHIMQTGSLCVNRRYCPQVHQDRDLQVLIKKGVVKQERWGTRCHKNTYLVLA